MEILHTPPVATAFTPLAEHQSRTPASFYEGPPVLHYHSDRCKVVILESDLKASSALNTLRGPIVNANGEELNGSSTAATATTQENNNAEYDSTDEKEVVINDVDIWVASDKLILYRSAATCGVAIPYPQISLHAIQRLSLPNETEETQGLYMQIANPSATEADGTGEDEEEESITLTIIPPSITQSASSALGSFSAGTETVALTASEMATEQADPTTISPDDNKAETATQALFAAVSACSNLHPDPIQHGEEDDEDFEGGDDYSYDAMDQDTHANTNAGAGSLLQAGLVIPGSSDGGLPPPMDGSSGWITADNMHEYFDEEGNWIGQGEAPSFGLPSSAPLGPGAGSVHARDGDDDGENGSGGAEGDNAGNEGEEAKWRRTD